MWKVHVWYAGEEQWWLRDAAPPYRLDPRTYPSSIGFLSSQAEAELLCDQFNIRDYGRVADVED